MRFIVFFLLFLTACATSSERFALQNEVNAQGFVRNTIQASPFLLTAYERVTINNSTVTVYIEGDGLAWLRKRTPSLDPTPKTPTALELALLDDSDNVIYLARPCQYSKLINEGACPQKYWTSHRFATEVIHAMDQALDDMKQRYQIAGFNLIGFSGGGNVAALLTARRDDVLSLRTVAGNLDHDTHNRIHNVSQMPASLNAKDFAHKINHIPQLHFIGAEDTIIKPLIFNSYYKASGESDCVTSLVVKDVAHNQGWKTRWKTLLNTTFPVCRAYK